MAQQPRVLIISEKIETRDAVVSALRNEFEMLSASEALQGYAIAKSEKPHLVILDFRTPGMDGTDLCLLLDRNPATCDIPVIALTDKRDIELHVKTFECGASEVLVVPFDIREFRARALNVLKRHEMSLTQKLPERQTVLSRGSLELDMETYDCRVGRESIRLSVLEFRLLRFFLENFTRVLSRQDVLREIWGDQVVSQRTIDTHIAGLRKKIAGSGLIFVSLYGVGYSLRGTTNPERVLMPAEAGVSSAS